MVVKMKDYFKKKAMGILKILGLINDIEEYQLNI